MIHMVERCRIELQQCRQARLEKLPHVRAHMQSVGFGSGKDLLRFFQSERALVANTSTNWARFRLAASGTISLQTISTYFCEQPWNSFGTTWAPSRVGTTVPDQRAAAVRMASSDFSSESTVNP